MEEIILSHLIHNETYARKVLPHLTSEMFYEKPHQVCFDLIGTYVEAYNALPSKEVLFIELDNKDNLSEEAYTETKAAISAISRDDDTKTDWLIDKTEKYVQDWSIQNALRRSISILDSDTELTKSAIPGLLQDALSVSFSTEVGHDFIEDSQSRFDFYNTVESKLKFNLDFLNRITGGGLPDKTLTIFMAGTGVGKSMTMGSLAAGNLMDQQNVLYISFEMAEERIAERIDANLLDVTLSDLRELSKADFDKKMKAVEDKTKGKMIIKEYPSASTSVAHIRQLLDELKIKKNFVPKIIYVDYINLMMSSRIKMAAGINSYTYIKAIAEELRGLATEYELPIVTATQTNRDGLGSSDLSLTNTSDSIGLSYTADLFLGMISTEELEEAGQIMFKQLKNRLGDPSIHRKFMVGVSKSHMRLYDIDNEVQEDTPVMDATDVGERIMANEMFEGFK